VAISSARSPGPHELVRRRSTPLSS
jgi:hypothetical protein